jgi:protein-L-isoaspartate(D-aspartate) O-methyltransferase
MNDPFAEQRQLMVEQQLRARGIRDEAVLRAMAKVPRELFLEDGLQESSYADGPLPIACRQTISQPYIVAYMTQLLALSGGESVLEIGTGSGYQAAVLAEIVARVYSVEKIPELSAAAADLLTGRLGYRNIQFKVGRGQEGWREFAPFDRILLTAAPEEFPSGLLEQLSENGIAVAPVGGYEQRLVRYVKQDGEVRVDEGIGVVFVPLV